MTAPTHAELLDGALAWADAGAAVIPISTDGTKRPAVEWKGYQATPASIEQVIDWLAPGTFDGIGIVTGAASGLEMLELEGRAIKAGGLQRLRDLADDNDMREVLDRLMSGYVEKTPSGGLHMIYRVSGGVVLRNTKLAGRPPTPEDIEEARAAWIARRGNDDGFKPPKVMVLAETRGEGGYVVVAPSFGRTHKTGKGWVAIAASTPAKIVTLTGEQRDMMLALFGLLDEMPTPDHAPKAPSLPGGSTPGDRPGDDFAARTSWDDILLPHGWTRAWKMGAGFAWVRPGKDRRDGISATTGQAADGVDRLYVFSTSTEFESEVPYTKFGAYALLEHGGDHRAAAKTLAAAGFGTQPSQPVGDVAALLGSGSPIPVENMPDPANVLPDYDTTAAGDDDLADAPAEPMLAEPVRTLVETETPAATLAMSEDGHSQALIAEYGVEIRYCHELGRWLHWDGARWEKQASGGGIVREYAKAIARAYPEDSQWRVHKKRSLTTQGINGALTMSTTDFRVQVGIDELDARPWELNTPAGIVNLRTGALTPANPKHLHTRITRIAPDFDADRTAWLSFLRTTFSGDDELIGFVQRLLGYALIGEVRENILPVFHGQGANGKTVLLETVQALIGDYAATLPPRFLVQHGQGVTDATVLLGVRFAVGSETNEGERFDEAIVKRLTGGDTIRARYMRQDWFEFTPSHLLVLMTNHLPEVGSGGTSFWRRVRAVPFNHVVPEEQRDPELKDRLIAEHAPAILAWLVEGAVAYVADGLREPEGVRVATKQYEASTDTVARFVDDMIILGGGEWVKTRTAAVRAAYETWCRSEGEQPVSAKAFTTQLVARYEITNVKGSKGVRFLTGVTLAGGDSDAPPESFDAPPVQTAIDSADPWRSS